jgi:hypothetical protein
MFLSKISEAIIIISFKALCDFISLNQHQKKALVIQLYEQGKTRRQIAEVAHMGFKDIAEVIRKHIGEGGNLVDKPEKSQDARAFELFLQGIQSVEVAIELDACRQGGRATCSVLSHSKGFLTHVFTHSTSPNEIEFIQKFTKGVLPYFMDKYNN